MGNFKTKVKGFMVLLVLCLSSYVFVVQVANALGSRALLDSFTVRSGGKLELSNVFQMGHVLVFTAVSRLANAYSLEIYQNSSRVIFTKDGEFYEGKADAEVLLGSPAFSVGHAYKAIFHAYACGRPIPGVFFTDSVTFVFTVVSVGTRLGLEAEYDGLMRGLYLCANLTTVDGCPVANETVDFHVQFESRKRRLTEGWVPLGSAKTDAQGLAELRLAFGLPDGNYSIRAWHKATENYGESKNVTNIRAFTDFYAGSFGTPTPSWFIANGTLTLEVSSQSPYALLPMNLTARYTSDVVLQGYTFMLFYLDSLPSRAFTGTTVKPSDGPPYVYEALVPWGPNVTGFHTIIAGVVNGTWSHAWQAICSGDGLIATTQVDIDVQQCPSNIVLDFPDSFYGDSVPVSVAVSKPRPYEPMVDDFCVATTLAPRLSYNGVEYVVDEGVEAAPLRLFVNDTLSFEGSTDEYGLAHFLVNLDSPSANVTAVVEGSSLLSETFVERELSYREICVLDRQNVESDCLKFDFTASNVVEGGKLYVSAQSQLEIEASMLNQSVSNLPVSVIWANLVSCSQTDMFGKVAIPDDSNYLRVLGTVGDTVSLRSEMYFDGVYVGDFAVDLVATWTYGSRHGHHRCMDVTDVNNDDRVVMMDFYSIIDNRWAVVFDNGETVLLDSQGFAKIPAVAKSLTLCASGTKVVGVSIEFFKIVYENHSHTNNLGRAVEAWAPNELGKCMVQVKSLPKFDVYLAGQGDVTSLDASTNLVRYFDVVKRPINLDVTFTPSQPTEDDDVTMVVNAFDGFGEPAQGLNVDFWLKEVGSRQYLWPIGSSSTNSSGVATLTWKPWDYHDLQQSYRWFDVSVNVSETSFTEPSSKAPVIIDMRYPTRMFFMINGEAVSGEAVNVTVGGVYDLAVKAVITGGDLEGQSVYCQDISFYLNDEFIFEDFTDINGMIYWWGWTVSEMGLYYFRACWSTLGLWDNKELKPANEIRLVAIAGVTPTWILFDVQPKDFKPESAITLNATVFRAGSNMTLPGVTVNFYTLDADESKVKIGEEVTN